MGTDRGSSSGLRRVLQLAKGGMGSVDVMLRLEGSFRRLVAVKRLLPEFRADPEFRAMFLDEAKLAGLIRHPNVVGVTDVGTDEDGPFLVMDYIEGLSLSAVMRAARARRALLPASFCVQVARDVARGLHAAHELRATDGTPLDLVHRDVTPHNVLLSFEGEVRVADFGIAKALGRGAKTSTGVLKGKLGYMSPEQLRFREPDRRSDLFALGVVLFEALASTRLYADGIKGARRILDEPPPDIEDHRDDIPPSLTELLFDLLAKAPEDRPATAAECAQRLDAVLDELALEESRVDLGAHLATHFAEERDAQRARLAEGLKAAEREGLATAEALELPAELAQSEAPTRADRPAPSHPAWAPVAVGVAAALALGAGAWWQLGASASDPEEASAPPPASEQGPPVGPAPEPAPEPAAVELAAPEEVIEEAEAALEEPPEDLAAAEPPRAARRRSRPRPSAAARAEEASAPDRSSVPQWGWDE